MPGSVTPQKCDYLSSCPAGSKVQQVYTGFIICGLIDLLLVALYLVRAVRNTRQQNLPITSLLPGFLQKYLKKHDIFEKSALLSNEVDMSDCGTATEIDNCIPLFSAFQRGLGGRHIGIDFKFEAMGLTLPNGKCILQGVQGVIKSSRMTAIMGPSGAGKTTFMNVLCGKVPRTSGNLWVNGKQCEMHHYKKMIGYVPQDDLMIRELSVREVLMHSAKIRLPSSWSNAEIEEYVDNLILALNLSHVQHTVIGDEVKRGISGGQRKRVNIGIELAAVPICMFLDEPTSGLDSTAALEVARILQQITSLGLTIVAAIHQPRIEIFEKFDDVLIIAPGGRTAYLGPTADAQQYFENLGYEFPISTNPADVLMDIISGKGINSRRNYTVDELVHYWQKLELVTDYQVRKSEDFEKAKKMIIEISESEWAALQSTSTTRRINLKDAKVSAESDNSSVESLAIDLPIVSAQGLNSSKDMLARQSSLKKIEEKTVLLYQATFHSSSPALIKERGASFFKQLMLCHSRSIQQQLRAPNAFLLEALVGALAGLVMGLSVLSYDDLYIGMVIPPFTGLSAATLEWPIPELGFVIGAASALAAAPAGVKVFSEERAVYWREASAGHSKLAYFLGKSLSVMYRIAICSLHFASTMHFLARPLMGFANQYVMILLVFFGVYGMAASISMIVARENAALLAVVICLFNSAFSGFGITLKKAGQWGLRWIWELSFNRWAAEAMCTRNSCRF